MSREQVSIRTSDGDCRAWLFTPDGAPAEAGSWPAAIFYMDGLAIRPTLFDMAQRLADGGYTVLLPDLFYRFGPYEPLDPAVIFGGGSVRESLRGLMTSTSNALAAQDTGSFLAFLDSRPEVKGSKVGVTGYCMGGAVALTVAGTYPDRIAAAASFHGGNLANDTELSSHLKAATTKARVLVAGADNDGGYPPEMAERLDRALSEAGVDHVCEIYTGALHGWTMRDFPVYDEAAAERHWDELFKLFSETLD